ncbi:heme-binding protein [Streptomyces sp. NBC_00878]|uniref:GlcG/HbpS family heme-binding protein n=1 Tax=Streptomyces sp. NBC_00878 TaxID=2975854 RepID=UPI002255F3CA|nr:heme-binding protein [Streptomyces sp. NBC_00878]MCX4909026.1 heme-binding protein [Streptomyces sp. NBC_00878]
MTTYTNPSVRSDHALTLTGAESLLEEGLRIARSRGLELCLAIVDPAGFLLAFRRMDGAPLVSIEVAISKARTAAYLKNPSRAFEEMIDAGKPSMLSTPGIVPLRGGVPVGLGDALVGAVGVSGATGEVDDEVAEQIAASLVSEQARDA